uniref:Uncharacterized protein n=1 Tax=Cacopsylla melanoneura TaxID=428564 RepID=A0A8D9BRN2_9HEMI
MAARSFILFPIILVPIIQTPKLFFCLLLKRLFSLSLLSLPLLTPLFVPFICFLSFSSCLLSSYAVFFSHDLSLSGDLISFWFTFPCSISLFTYSCYCIFLPS